MVLDIGENVKISDHQLLVLVGEFRSTLYVLYDKIRQNSIIRIETWTFNFFFFYFTFFLSSIKSKPLVYNHM